MNNFVDELRIDVATQGGDLEGDPLRGHEPSPAPEAGGESAPVIDLDAPELYLNRELTWLDFSRRVLHEAKDVRNPLLERVKFLAIMGSIYDEFLMKRVGGLKQQLAAGVKTLTVDGRSPAQQIVECHEFLRETYADIARVWSRMREELADNGIKIVTHDELTRGQQEALRDYYFENIYPLVTPQAVDPAHPFPFVSNLSLNLLVSLRVPGDATLRLARVKVPLGDGVKRFVRIQDTQSFIALDDVIAHNLDLIFPGMDVDDVSRFRVTRNADVERAEEQADDLLALIESELRERKFAPVVRLQVSSDMKRPLRAQLADELGLDEEIDVFETAGLLALRDLTEIASLDIPSLKHEPMRPVDHALLADSPNVLHTIRAHTSILLHHPYESFASSVIRFLEHASEDPRVRAIKMTLYRASSQSRIVPLLIRAALNGKQVAVVMELKARFDEEANIRWASELEQAGIHVTYGVVGLKTHCKLILVVRQDHDGLRRYVHIGTGNYNEDTAKSYADVGLLTCDPAVGRDATELFNYLTTGYNPRRSYERLLPAPKLLKSALLHKIQREIAHQRAGRGGVIRIKTNALEDPEFTRALYEASCAGVRVELIVRDSCQLRPGLAGVSENIRVVSIVGRFLEHARVYYFRNGGEDEEILIGSADCMRRNLNARVEVVVPVVEPALQAELKAILDAQLDDQRSAWEMHSDGTYEQRNGGPDAISSQTQMSAWARHRAQNFLDSATVQPSHPMTSPPPGEARRSALFGGDSNTPSRSGRGESRRPRR